ncbi:PAS domain S-box protein [Peijinzhouia sedimentorum]
MGESKRILIIEDNLGDQLILKEYLSDSSIDFIQTDCVESLAEGIAHIENQSYDIVFLDLNLSDSKGLVTFNHLLQRFPNQGILVLSGLDDEAIGMQAVSDGALDYLVKGKLDPFLLEKTLRYAFERMRYIKELKDSEQKYKYLFKYNPFPMWITDRKAHRILNANEAALNTYGYTREEFLGMSTFDFRSDAEKVRLKNYYTRESDAFGYINAGEWKHLTKAGKEIEVSIYTQRLTYEGADARLVAIYDITEQNKTKEKLSKSELKFRSLAENFPNGVIALLDKDLKIVYTDGTGFAKEGLNPRDFEGRFYPDLFDIDNKQLAESELNKVLAGESSIFQLSAESRTYLVSAIALENKGHEDGGIILSTFEITEQRKAEEQIYFQAEILQNIKESVVVTDSKGIITYWNGGAEAFLGFEASEVLGNNIKSIYPETSRLSNSVREKLINHGQISDEINLKHKNGEIKWILSIRKGLFDKHGNFMGIIGVSHDITERKQIEHEQALLTEELSKQNKELQQFSYIVSHNLRAPVVNIRSFLNLLEVDDIQDDWNKEIIGKLDIAIQRMESTLGDLINAISFKKDTTVPKTEIYLDSFCEGILQSIEHQFKKAKAEISTDFSKASSILYLPFHLENILMNLFTNAIKYKKPDVPLKLAIQSYNEGQFLIIEVSDNGLGIDLAKFEDRIFGLYQRFHENVSDGRGIGLYLIKNQLKAMGGDLLIESQVGVGSTFKAYIKRS